MAYDSIIIGSGMAGMTAGIYAVRRKMNILIISKDIGGQIIWASKIDNYPGFKSIDSFELIQKVQDQVESMGVKIKISQVQAIVRKKNNDFTVVTNENQYQTKTIILASGLSPRQLNVPGEKELVGKGLSYCANCDGMFFKDKAVGVVGAGNSALDAAEVLSKIAKKVYLIHRSENFRAFDILIKKISSINNIQIMNNSEIKRIIGQERLEKVQLLDKNTNNERLLDLDGLFLEIGREPDTVWLNNLVKIDDLGQIIINNEGLTNQSGIFAGGDVTNNGCKQIVVACAQGAIAALSAYRYLQLKT